MTLAAASLRGDTGGMDEGEYRERLSHDVAGWLRDGMIEAAQERAILARIGAGEPRLVGALRMGWLVTAVSVLGALALGGGVLLLIGTQWDTIPDGLRAALIVGAMVASYAMAYVLIYRLDMQRIGSSFLLLGYLIYVAGVFLLPQIYNMPICDPDSCDSPNLLLMYLAAAGAFPLAYAFASRIILLVGIGALVAAVGVTLADRYPDSPEAEASLVVFGAFAVGLYAAGRLHALRGGLERFGEMYMLAGVLVLLGLVYIFSFRWIWNDVLDSDFQSFSAPNFVYVAIALAATITLVQWFTRGRGIENDLEAVIMLAVLAAGAVVATWPNWSGYAFVFSVMYFAVAIGLVARGYLDGDERQVNLGLLVVAFGMMTRYFDYFWDTGAQAAFFMVGGALLLAVAFGLERLRRGLLKGMGDPDRASPALGAAEVVR